MLIGVLFVLLQSQAAVAKSAAVPEEKTSQSAESTSRCVTVGESPDQRVAPVRAIAPGPPPFLSFRYFEGKLHHRYGNLDLMLDDAGH